MYKVDQSNEIRNKCILYDLTNGLSCERINIHHEFRFNFKSKLQSWQNYS